MAISKIPSRIECGAVDELGHQKEVTGAKDILDDTLGKRQNVINQDVNDKLEGIENRLEEVEELAQISLDGGEAQIGNVNDFVNPTQEQKAKIPTVGAVYDSIIGIRVPLEYPTESEVGAEISISPNKLYVFSNAVTGLLEIKLNAPTDNSKENEYMVQFTAGEGAEVNFYGIPSSGGGRVPIRWLNDDPIAVEAGYTYQVSIIDHLAVYCGWEPNS